MNLRLAIAGLLITSLPFALFSAQAVPEQAPIPLPPLGWGTWNSFGNAYDSKTIMREAKAMVSSGMRDAGYQYVLIDEGWWQGKRDAHGNIVVDPKQWPAIKPGEKAGDMSNIVRYIHSLGLKAATYTDAGRYGCGTYSPDSGPGTPGTGSFRHYAQDFLQFAKWGFDYVKVDWCGGDKPNLDPAVQYAEIARAIRRAESITHHRMFFSICDWGRQSPWTWGPGIGGIWEDMWRTGGDISAPIVESIPAETNRWVSLRNVYRNFDAGIHPEAQHTGYYNDLDMMVLGMRGMTERDDRVHMSLWAISGAPLIVGADITKLNRADIAILTNREVLAVDQDPLGLQCVKIAEPGPGLQVWAKMLAQPGERAVVLLNRTNAPASVSFEWSDLGFRRSTHVSVRDLWAGKDLDTESSSYAVTVPSNDVVMLIVKGVVEKPERYRPVAASAKNPLPSVQDEVTFKNVAAALGSAFVQITYVNNDKTPVMEQLRVNEQDATNIAFPPTSATAETVTIETNLRPSKNNLLRFSPEGPSPLRINSIAVLPF